MMSLRAFHGEAIRMTFGLRESIHPQHLMDCFVAKNAPRNDSRSENRSPYMPNIHPFLVHFPVALLTTALTFDILGILLGREELSRVGWWAQLVGTIGIATAVASGLVAKSQAFIPPAAAETFDIHQQFAFLTAGAFAALFLWRIAMRSRIAPTRRFLFLALYTVALACLWVGAWYGGELVFRFGIGFTLPPG
jgi:uncharacterized membrane protein